MRTDRSSNLQRYLAACLAASLVTLVILFVMTQLVSPIGGDRVVTQMLLQLEIQRRPDPDMPSGIRVFELPQERAIRDTSDSSDDEDDRPKSTQGESSDDAVEATEDDADGTEDDAEGSARNVVDWWAQARAISRDLNDAEFEEWLESQGYKKWVSVMQGHMPNLLGPTTPSEQGEPTSAYRNPYGDLVIPINESCTMQVQSRLFDSSNFARNIPPLIVCRGASGIDLSGLDEYVNSAGGQ